MAVNVPGVGLVPIVWMPASDEDYRDESEGGRSGYRPIAIVHHRIVASLNSADLTFAANDANPATVGSPNRSVSANFAIGYDSDGKLYIHQYVDLSDTAYCNGDCRAVNYPDQPSRWDGWYGHEGHNERTVSIEHDDQGGSSDPTKKGIVREPIILTSIALDSLMLSGDLVMMRAAGIRIRDQETADALGKIVPSTKTLIDHNDIAGANKPDCWRPWQADKTGFPRTRYVTALTAPASTEEPMIATYAPGSIAVVGAGQSVRKSPHFSPNDNLIRKTTADESWAIIGTVLGQINPIDGSGVWYLRWNAGQYEYTVKDNIVSVTPPITQAQVDAAVNAAAAAATDANEAKWETWVATHP